jgi:uncharacterized protein YndB with AHSA1/START domain
MPDATPSLEARSVTVQRLIRAPPERVFPAFLGPEALSRWFGPAGFRLTTHAMDTRPGGLWRFTMHGPDGTDYANWVHYLEIDAPRRIVWDQGDQVGTAPWFRTTITFDAVPEGTHLVLQSVFPTKAARDHNVEEYHAVEGGKQTLERLAVYLKAV